MLDCHNRLDRQFSTYRFWIKEHPEKRAMNFDKVVGEWKCKADDLMSELEACNSECRNYSSEVYRLKTAYDDWRLRKNSFRLHW